MAMFLENKVSTTTSPHFFKIIEEESLHNIKLQIPKKIVRKCGQTLTDQVLLKPPCGLEWKIGLSKSSDGKVWIEKGWPEFSKHYSIVKGHLLVLRYEGNSQFNVLIFDQSSIEIDYPTQQVKEEIIDVEKLDPFTKPCPKTREKSPSAFSRPQKRIKKCPNLSPKGMLNFADKDQKSSTASQLSMEEKAQALKRASGFKSKHPFFVLPMQPSYVQTKFALNVPLDFARKYVGTSNNVILTTPSGKTWPVKLRFRVYYGKSRSTIESGWKDFALENDLKRGDVCVFALTNTTNHESILFEVSIFRHKEIASSVKQVVNKPAAFKSHTRKSKSNHKTLDKKLLLVTAKARALETANSFQSENPFFTIIILASYLNCKGNVTIPAMFGRTYMKKNQSSINLSVSNGTKCWSIRCKSRVRRIEGSQGFLLCRGWSKFAWDNGLKEGDVCTFELTNRDGISFKVHIAKVSQEEMTSVSRITKRSVVWDKFSSTNPNFQFGCSSTHSGNVNNLQENLPL